MCPHVRPVVFGAMALIGLAAAPAASGRGGLSGNYWSATRVGALPSELRDRLAGLQSACGGPLSAGPSFTREIRDPRSAETFIALHLHDLHCDHQAVCRESGCLHE